MVDLSWEDSNSGAGIVGAPQQNSTPIKQRRPSDRSCFRKEDGHLQNSSLLILLNELSDRREDRQRGGPSPSSSWAIAWLAVARGGILPPRTTHTGSWVSRRRRFRLRTPEVKGKGSALP